MATLVGMAALAVTFWHLARCYRDRRCPFCGQHHGLR